MAISNSESAGDRLHLVQLSPRPTESGAAHANAWGFYCAAREVGNFRRRADCSGRRDQSVSSNRSYLSGLPKVLESCGEPYRDTRVFTSRLTCTMAGI